MRQRVRTAWAGRVEPALASALDAAGVGETDVLRIPSVELSVHLDGLEDLETVLPTRLAEALQARLADLIVLARAEQQPANGRLQAGEQWVADVLAAFVVEGRLPQAAPADPRFVLGIALLRPEGLRLMTATQHSESAWFRALRLLDAAQLPAFLESVIGAMVASGQPAALTRTSLPALQRLFAQPAIRTQATPDAGATAAFPVSLHDRLRIAAAWLAGGRMPASAPEAALAARAATAAGDDVARTGAAAITLARGVLELPREQAPVAAAGSIPNDATPIGLEQERAATPPREPGRAVRTLTVSAAGLVLLHPYLRRFLEGRHLLRDGTVLEGDLPRAAALLHVLATGVDDPDPFHGGLVDLLLGRSPDAPLLVGQGLAVAADFAAADQLLQAVIGHWTVLKNTSSNALRRGFLLRRGLVQRREHGWHLTVDPAAHDVLLDHLPWGIGIVQLSWMRSPLFVEWGRT